MQRVRHANRGRLLAPDTWSYPIWDLHLFIKPKPHYLLVTLTEYGLLTEIYITELERFQQNICNGCGMPAGDADSSGHLVLSHFGTCMCSHVETNLSWTCLVSGLLNFEHPSVLIFCSNWIWHLWNSKRDSIIQLERYTIQFERSSIELESSAIELESSPINWKTLLLI